MTTATNRVLDVILTKTCSELELDLAACKKLAALCGKTARHGTGAATATLNCPPTNTCGPLTIALVRVCSCA